MKREKHEQKVLHNHKKKKNKHTQKQDRLFNKTRYLCLSLGPRHLYHEAEAHNFSWELLEFPFVRCHWLNKETKEKRHVVGDKYLHFQCFFRLKCKILFLFKGTRNLEMSLKNHKTSISAFVGSNLLITGWFSDVFLHLQGFPHFYWKYGESERF